MEDGLDVKAGEPPQPRKSRKKAVWIAIAVALFFVVFVGDPPFYFAKALRGRVVDKETGQPLAGAVVLAEWLLEPQVFGFRFSEPLHRVEVVTNANGEYEIGGWGPMAKPAGYALGYMSPKIYFAYPRYYIEELSNDGLGEASRDRSIVRSSKWNGQTISLSRFDGDWKRYGVVLDSAWSPNWSCTLDCLRFLSIVISENDIISERAPKDLNLSTSVSIDRLDREVQDALRKANLYAR